MQSHPLQHHVSQRFKYRQQFVFDHEEDSSITPHENPISLHFGCPHDGFFPVDSISLNVVNEPFQTYRDPQSEMCQVTIPRARSHPDQVDIAEAFQYGGDYGMDQFQAVLKEIVSKSHLPGFNDWDFVVSFGTGDAVYKVFDLFLDPNDSVLVEQYTFVPTLSSITCFGANLVPLEMNFYGDGIDLDYLTNLLENWEALHPDKKFPKCLYTIPSGQNPTGTTQTLATREKIYELSCKYDIIIIEDDPYGYLSLAPYNAPNPFDSTLDTSTYFEKYVPQSYIELDTQGRVVRLESFSKVCSPGLRLGMIITNSMFIEKIKLFIAISSKQPSGASEAIFYSIYKHFGGFEGWCRWLIKLSHEYTARKQALMSQISASTLCKSGKLHVLEPSHGMFLTIEFKFKSGTNVPKALNELEKIGLEQGVLFVLGSRLSFEDEGKQKASFVRLALSPGKDIEELSIAGKRFIDTCQIYFARHEKDQ
ncbi:aromatic-amino-acid:2-oxoglutarate transaminase [Saccharomycopsis crataegensis]|uniref:Aromatic-amino-acid:2-oxoglutarate transaminase n=1 Tax=Saccharomycopsis crataegensis TaxID=43959 RepID=A0AAV5QDG2_9ASCO|nr:aromatic-amino-acid:2-oxoglutarate transaminase [Saccharomycopsis crataegensis]